MNPIVERARFLPRVRRPAPLGRVGAVAGLLAFLLVTAAAIAAEPPARETFAIDYVVTIDAKHPETARIRWEVMGADEVEAFEFAAPPSRFSRISGSGEVQIVDGSVRWEPLGPYGHLEYRVRVDHPRGDRGRYDSYAGDGWVVTRARDLFPPVKFSFKPGKEGAKPRSRSRLQLRLPTGWRSVTAHAALEPNLYQLSSPNVLSRPTGWIAAGDLDVSHQEIDGVMVRIARAADSKLPVDAIYAMLADAIPRLRKMFRGMPPDLLIVSAGDPMWRGGLSAYRSMFLHGDRPLRTPDKTAPVLHELIHVTQPFRAAADADWIVEGLAEYYSLELQRRAATLTSQGFGKGLESFAKYGLWGVDLRTQHDNAATNNSAPLVMYALDQRIQRETAGKQRLDDVVRVLAEERGEVSTNVFRAAVRKVTGKKLDKFFARHVERGEKPKFDVGG